MKKTLRTLKFMLAFALIFTALGAIGVSASDLPVYEFVIAVGDRFKLPQCSPYSFSCYFSCDDSEHIFYADTNELVFDQSRIYGIRTNGRELYFDQPGVYDITIEYTEKTMGRIEDEGEYIKRYTVVPRRPLTEDIEITAVTDFVAGQEFVAPTIPETEQYKIRETYLITGDQKILPGETIPEDCYGAAKVYITIDPEVGYYYDEYQGAATIDAYINGEKVGLYYVLKLISKNAEAPPNGIRFSTRTKTKLKGTQTDFYIREGAFCRIAFLHSVGCRSPPFLPASFDLMVI